MELYFYYVDGRYIDYLKKYEKEHNAHTCVPNLSYKTADKFLFGAVLEVNGKNYFVPVSSYSRDRQDVILIRDKKNRAEILGSLRFAYMIPVPRGCLVKLDISSMPEGYGKVHISKELAFCRRERDKIFRQTQKTYYRVTGKADEQLVKNSCDFRLLEQAYDEYIKDNVL